MVSENENKFSHVHVNYGSPQIDFASTKEDPKHSDNRQAGMAIEQFKLRNERNLFSHTLFMKLLCRKWR